MNQFENADRAINQFIVEEIHRITKRPKFKLSYWPMMTEVANATARYWRHRCARRERELLEKNRMIAAIKAMLENEQTNEID